MNIESAELYELSLPLKEPFAISGGVMRDRRSLIVALHDGEGHVGYGESPPFELPFYSGETLTSARDLLERVLLPRVIGKTFDRPEDVDAVLAPGVRGNRFAWASHQPVQSSAALHWEFRMIGAPSRWRDRSKKRFRRDIGG